MNDSQKSTMCQDSQKSLFSQEEGDHKFEKSKKNPNGCIFQSQFSPK